MITNQQQVPGAIASDVPAAISNGDNYLLAWAATDRSIWWTTGPASKDQNSYNWNASAQIINAATSGGPTLANLNGTVWMAWKGEGTDTGIYLASLNGSNWILSGPISGIGTSSSPSLASNGTALFLAWRGASDKNIYWSKSSDGKSWGVQLQVPGAASSDTPALAGFNGNIYLAFKGVSDNSILFSSYSDAKGWAKANALSSSNGKETFGSSMGPALGIGDSGIVHLVCKSAFDNSLWAGTLSTGNVWSEMTQIPVVLTATRPSLASQLSTATDILLVWKGATTTGLFFGPLDGLLTKQNYNFVMDYFQILNTRSGNIFSTSKDTDYASIGLTINNGQPQVKTQSMGNITNGTYPTPKLFFAGVTIADDDKVVFTYHIINSSVGESNASTYLQSVAFKLSSAAVQAITTTAGGITGAALGASVGAALGIAIPVPLIGSALGALGGWLLGTAWGVAFPDCDGPVASAIHVFSGADLRAMTANGPYNSTESNPGVTSPDGCGSNSSYAVTWTTSCV